MRIQIRFRGVKAPSHFERYVHWRLGSAFGQAEAHIESVTATMGRGHDAEILCQVSMRVRPNQRVEVETRNVDMVDAVDHAVSKLSAAAERVLERKRSSRLPRSLAPIADELVRAMATSSPGAYRMIHGNVKQPPAGRR